MLWHLIDFLSIKAKTEVVTLKKSKTINCVCTANICRSPMAEKLLAHALKDEKEPLRSYKVISSGIAALDGDSASEYSISVLKELNIDLRDHQSQRVTQKLFEASDLIFCMTETHRNFLKINFSDEKKPIFLIRELINDTLNTQVPDPFGAHLSDYEDCRDSISEAIPSIINYLKKNI